MPTTDTCPVCNQAREDGRWDEATCWDWIEDCHRWRGEVLRGHHVHWCLEWDGLPVDETTDEHAHCSCFAPPPASED